MWKVSGFILRLCQYLLLYNVNGKMMNELEKICNEVAVVCWKHGAQLLSEGPKEITKKRHKAGVRAEV
jgi:hypothetical protein